MGGHSKPVILEGTLQSPKMLAVAYGENAQEMAVAVRALGSAIQNLQQQFNSAYGRVAVHMTTSNQPPQEGRCEGGSGTEGRSGQKAPDVLCDRCIQAPFPRVLQVSSFYIIRLLHCWLCYLSIQAARDIIKYACAGAACCLASSVWKHVVLVLCPG